MFVAGFNTVGYIPHAEPVEFENFDDAKGYMIGLLLVHADDCDEAGEHDEAEMLSSFAEDLNLCTEDSVPWEEVAAYTSYWIFNV